MAQCAEITQANLSSKADVSRALDGAEVVFLVTAYSVNGSDGSVERQQGELVADIAKVNQPYPSMPVVTTMANPDPSVHRLSV